MKLLTRREYLSILLILSVIGIITLLNMRIAVRRARDIQRREDIGKLVDILNTYRDGYGFLPLSEDGKIKGCKAENFDQVTEKLKTQVKFDLEIFNSGLRTCLWGKDPFPDVLTQPEKNYLSTLPRDPGYGKGIDYNYLSNGRLFQIYAFLEGASEEPGFNEGIIKRGLKCGEAICNFGRASPGVPIEKSLEEYEEELLKTGN